MQLSALAISSFVPLVIAPTSPHHLTFSERFLLFVVCYVCLDVIHSYTSVTVHVRSGSFEKRFSSGKVKQLILVNNPTPGRGYLCSNYGLLLHSIVKE